MDKHNKVILQNIIDSDFNVNMLFYGPPGTGKTTTIISLVSEYNKKHNGSSSLVMNLNASDDRGIELIRNQLYAFVNSNHMFTSGRKIIVLDEADYMTKLAQQALKLMIEQYSDVRFILICNYITKIDRSLQNILMHIRFNNLPRTKIIRYLRDLCDKENISLTIGDIEHIQHTFDSDIRSMINYIQFNHACNNKASKRNQPNCSKPDTYATNECLKTDINTVGNGNHTLISQPKGMNMQAISRIISYCEYVVKQVHMYPENSNHKSTSTALSAGHSANKYASHTMDFLKFMGTLECDERFMWIDLFAHIFKTYRNSHIYVPYIDYIVHNSNMTNRQMNVICFTMLCKILDSM